jgi:hypothetical protein
LYSQFLFIVKPCSSGKKQFVTEAIAEEALIDAQASYDYGRTSGPVAVYLCDECGYYHLTSRGPMNAKLSAFLQEGKLSRERIARQWTEKFKKR